MLDNEELKRGVAQYGGSPWSIVVNGRVINASEACDACMSAAMAKCGDKPHDQAVAIAISECKDKCPTQPKNDDDNDMPEPPAPIAGGS